MKIQIIEANTNRPLANTKVQLQVKGKDAGFLTLTSDTSGYITLDEKLSGQQISATSSTASTTSGASDATGVKATDGAKLVVGAAFATETTSSGRSSK